MSGKSEVCAAIDNVCFRYVSEPVLCQVNLSVRRGDFIAVTGNNGAGKSTLLRLLLGELRPELGEIRLFGQPVEKFDQWPRVGYVPQRGFTRQIGFPATALEIVRAHLVSQVGIGHPLKRQHRDLALAALEQVGLSQKANQLIGNLSGGQVQRVMLARALVGQPELLLLDEPTSGVDNQSVEEFLQLLVHLNEEHHLTLMMVTHDVARAVEVVKRVACLEGGTLVELSLEQVRYELEHRHQHHPPKEHDHVHLPI